MYTFAHFALNLFLKLDKLWRLRASQGPMQLITISRYLRGKKVLDVDDLTVAINAMACFSNFLGLSVLCWCRQAKGEDSRPSYSLNLGVFDFEGCSLAEKQLDWRTPWISAQTREAQSPDLLLYICVMARANSLDISSHSFQAGCCNSLLKK